MYLSLIILPLLGCIVSGFFGRKVGSKGAQLITCLCVIITTALSILCFIEVGLNNIPVTINLFRWIDSEWFNIIWGFQYDSLTVSMLIPVLIISSLVHIYSISYMSSDPHNPRFFSYLSLFTFMMIILVTANNYLLMFVGWEGVGVCSYLLVSFWFTRIAANQSSIAAFLANRVGDCFLTIGMFAILWSLGNLDYSTVFSLAPYVNSHVVTIIGICLLIGAMAKSSQVGLHIWLPMAMEGPTPVSALIHAATMVTAGVYLLMRSSPLVEYSNTVLLFCLWLGAITTVFSSLIGLFQQDIKKIVAYSTMSQLGLMVICIGLSSYNIALFHLINHAFYKALLFLGAGSVIHAVADNQDLRKYGGLLNYLPLTYSVMLIASLSLVAFPFMTGFYSKDFILESAYGQFSYSGVAAYIIATIGAIFTTLYSVKVLHLTFLANPNGPRSYYRLAIDNLFQKAINYKPAHEGDFFLTLPLVLLALFSIFFGFITRDIFIGLGSNIFADNSLFIHPIHEIMIDTEFAVPVLFKLLPFIFTISFSILAIILPEFLPWSVIETKLNRLGYNIFGFFNQRFLVEFYINKYITNPLLKLGGLIVKILDKGILELVGPFGLEKFLAMISIKISGFNTSVVPTYGLYILVSCIVFISFTFSDPNLPAIITTILALISEKGENKEDSISNSQNNKQLINNSITYIYNNKRMFSTSAILLLNPNDGNSDNHSDNNPGNDSYNDNNEMNSPKSSRANSIIEKLKDKSELEYEDYWENKIREAYQEATEERESMEDDKSKDLEGKFAEQFKNEEDLISDELVKKLASIQEKKKIVDQVFSMEKNEPGFIEDWLSNTKMKDEEVDSNTEMKDEEVLSAKKRKHEESSDKEDEDLPKKRKNNDNNNDDGDGGDSSSGGGDSSSGGSGNPSGGGFGGVEGSSGLSKVISIFPDQECEIECEECEEGVSESEGWNYIFRELDSHNLLNNIPMPPVTGGISWMDILISISELF